MRYAAITKRQRQVLAFIIAYKKRYECAPTLQEIGAHMGIDHVNAVLGHLRALQTKGALQMLHDANGRRIARAIKVLTPAK